MFYRDIEYESNQLSVLTNHKIMANYHSIYLQLYNNHFPLCFQYQEGVKVEVLSIVLVYIKIVQVLSPFIRRFFSQYISII
jgi:hypothetical protein